MSNTFCSCLPEAIPIINSFP
ncbi:hypothetical protein CGLO_11113 [Colletotrichum gloeosporioides Cg-14]|uniref:Uncharacterized protein n=1 Tax=Colletotrichum gloeosporioides (strain Cg-14) TaxID=1237896 RepID=T0KBT3_COLGC|nr:hypothetical protein CGLO_11113 [Colletotrichum gloeosporioides Cg-14]